MNILPNWARDLLGRRLEDAWWSNFVNREPADPKNVLTGAVRAARGGPVYPLKTEVHDPGAMARHLIDFARFLGADAAGVVAVSVGDLAAGVELADKYRFALVCGVQPPYDPAVAKGLGGQFAPQRLAIINFSLRSYLRELGYGAEVVQPASHALAKRAGLGRADKNGRFSALNGRSLWLGDVVVTDLPLDGPGAAGGGAIEGGA